MCRLCSKLRGQFTDEIGIRGCDTPDSCGRRYKIQMSRPKMHLAACTPLIHHWVLGLAFLALSSASSDAGRLGKAGMNLVQQALSKQ